MKLCGFLLIYNVRKAASRLLFQYITTMMYKRIATTIALFALTYAASAQQNREPHREQFHFSPKAHWMNDPNGMVYYQGTYHLFFQYYPNGTTWGPMHWGHTTSKDMVYWQEQPIALYPDNLGLIFSGSVVVDTDNTSGFGRNGQVPLVAIFTHHNQTLEKTKSDTFQYQSIAYSLDAGKSWTKYAGNPVLPNPGIVDFRDPKVRWFAPTKRWIMTLATKDRITFYSSPNLKNWTKESEFGEKLGAHGGVWECPDLFPLTHDGKTVWTLLSSINPGGPNGGSATQYFLGDFDGHTFKPLTTKTRWMDYGPDNYAGVTFANTGNRTMLMGWMSNWDYANTVPTEGWRSTMTVPRELGLRMAANELYLTSVPVKELSSLDGKTTTLTNLTLTDKAQDLTARLGGKATTYKLTMTAPATADVELILSNSAGNELLIGYDNASNTYYIDRRKSGKVSFDKSFARRSTAPRLSTDRTLSLSLLVDVASVELVADDGLSVMTGIFFPEQVMTNLSIRSSSAVIIPTLSTTQLKPALP